MGTNVEGYDVGNSTIDPSKGGTISYSEFFWDEASNFYYDGHTGVNLVFLILPFFC